nr:immunoglobulin light chain junction region [Macaca mulatta]MOX69407.1 immunoglobulin light chain junction region [Macaca mulatta]MOX71045.1 immunoglobulin light chain junction region [Macaca mulatta]MOX71423.1 immunoglobulin light chain junction region [Macaca mulatta]MOX71760.1 immunoglobulin light chain junction region [Macaca mulatta]
DYYCQVYDISGVVF